MDLITYIPGIANSGLFTPGPNTPSPWNVPIIGAVDGISPATATRNMAEIYNRLLFAHAALVEAAGLAIDHDDWAQLVHAFRSNGLVYAAGAGTANAQTVAYTPALKALVDGMVLWYKAAVANTGPATLNVNGLGAVPIMGGAHGALQGGEIVANGRCRLLYNATLGAFILLECTGAPLQVGLATQSQHAMQLGQATGRWINRQIITATGPYAPTAGTNYGDVTVIAGGGGGGGCQATGSGQMAAGAGGGGGGWARRRLTIAQMTGQTMTVGGAGTAGVIGSGAGGNGGASSFGALVSATGGIGGSFGVAVTASNVTFVGVGAAGLGSNGDVNGFGGNGRFATYSPGGGIGGDGGFSLLGGGAAWASGTSGGTGASVRGAGGGGGVVQGSNATGAQGGIGGAGLIIIDEFA
ncbi:hypothetical protein FHT32_001282 [Variovorax sp. SG517]|uniref:hypothetical protein n=1 Tax=Variovorax sp. SG517 TaxID=2587117 RepID=UPI00159D3741|nr:hypothetical protein [Variovorax sp. SG517]NVM87643.1 hypothetical protein [Variovorax sp. SG517]